VLTAVGHYVPAVASGIHSFNNKGGHEPFNLKGLAIGNGLTNPVIQYNSYAGGTHNPFLLFLIA